MALIIETGQAAANSESYASVADADLYLANRGMTNWATMTTPEKEQALRRATDYIGQNYGAKFEGSRVSDTQALDFPRFNMPRMDGTASYYASDVVPKNMVSANIELALRAAAGELLEDVDTPVTSEQVGSIRVTYAEGATQTKKFPVIDKLLSAFIVGGGGSIGSIKFIRA